MSRKARLARIVLPLFAPQAATRLVGCVTQGGSFIAGDMRHLSKRSRSPFAEVHKWYYCCILVVVMVCHSLCTGQNSTIRQGLSQTDSARLNKLKALQSEIEEYESAMWRKQIDEQFDAAQPGWYRIFNWITDSLPTPVEVDPEAAAKGGNILRPSPSTDQPEPEDFTPHIQVLKDAIRYDAKQLNLDVTSIGPETSIGTSPSDPISDLKKIVNQEIEQLESTNASPQAGRMSSSQIADILQRARQRRSDLSNAEIAAQKSNDDLDQQLADAQTQAQKLKAQQVQGFTISVPSGWVPCQCPAQHPGAGIIVNGVQYHTPLLHCH